MSELENGLEAFFHKRVRLLGGYLIKLAPTVRGIPDRLVFFPGGRMFLVELKTEDGKRSPIQVHWHQKLAALDVPVHTLHGRHDIIVWLRRVVDAVGPDSIAAAGARSRKLRGKGHPALPEGTEMPELPEAPAVAEVISCPACGHQINEHTPELPGDGQACYDPDGCACHWSPNDIAWHALYGGLTQLSSSTQRVARQADGTWVEASLS